MPLFKKSIKEIPYGHMARRVSLCLSALKNGRLCPKTQNQPGPGRQNGKV